MAYKPRFFTGEHRAITTILYEGLTWKDYDLGYIDLEERILQALHNPFGPKV
jgi:hypothetical protein